VPAATIDSGNIAVARLTNALAAGSYSVPAASVDSGNIAAARLSNALAQVCVNMPVTVTATSDTNVTISAQVTDLTGASVNRSVGFEFWFSTTAVQTLPDTNGVQSFSTSQGTIRSYWLNLAGTNPVYVAQTSTAGLFTLAAVCIPVTWTNQFHLLGPNGYYTNATVVWDAP
jgi:hypothetical protein